MALDPNLIFPHSNIFGIDLGSTHFRIAGLDQEGKPHVIQNPLSNSDSLTAAVLFDTADSIIIGEVVLDMLETDGDRVVRFNPNELRSPNDRSYEFFGRTYTPADICSLILRRLKDMAQEQGYQVKKVVITCPAFFTVADCSAILAAANAAGLEVLSLISTPLAAALSCLDTRLPEYRTVLVCDLGGRIFDVSLLNTAVHPDQDNFRHPPVRFLDFERYELGGEDWSDVLHSHLLDTCCEENGLFPEELDTDTRQSLRSKAESLKMKLTSNEFARARIFVNGAMTKIAVTRAEFEEMTESLVLRAMCYVEALLQRADDAKPDLVLLTGGGAHMPMIQQAMKDRFPGQLLIHEPGQAAAMGAAVYARMLSSI